MSTSKVQSTIFHPILMFAAIIVFVIVIAVWGESKSTHKSKFENDPGISTPQIRSTKLADQTIRLSEPGVRMQRPDSKSGPTRIDDDKPGPVTSKRIEPLSAFPEFAKARSRNHRVIELTFCALTHQSPTRRDQKAITVNTQKHAERELELIERKFFFIADELHASQADGQTISGDTLVESLQTEQAVLVTHYPVELATHYLAALNNEAIVIQIPYLPRVSISAETFGERNPLVDELDFIGDGKTTLQSFPEFCMARARQFGIVEVLFTRLFYLSPDKRGRKAITVADGSSTKELTLFDSSQFLLATELRAYRADGTTLSREELLYELEDDTVVLCTLAPSRPPPAYIRVLAPNAVVLELPYEPLIPISADDLKSTKGATP